MSTFPHCHHCAWSHPAHVETHVNGCGCDESPYAGVAAIDADVPLFEMDGAA